MANPLMDTPVRLVYKGEILEGFKKSEVKHDLGQWLKLDPNKLEKMFSGERVVIRREVPEEEGEQLVQRFRKRGAVLRMEHLRPPDNPSTRHEPTVLSAPEPSSLAAFALAHDDVVCGECGEVQFPRPFCRHCGADLSRALPATPNTVPKTKPAPVAQARGSKTDAAAPRPAWALSDAPPLFGLGWHGRMGRVSYAIGGLLGLSAAAWLLMGMLLFPGVLGLSVVLIGLALLVLWGLRLTALRLHDMGYSGWLALLALVPAVGWLGNVVLAFAPGSAQQNRYGREPKNTAVLIGLAAVLLVMVNTGYVGHATWSSLEQRWAEFKWPPDDWGAVFSPPTIDLKKLQRMPSDDELAEHLKLAKAIAMFQTEYWPAGQHRAFALSEDGAMGWYGGADTVLQAKDGALAACQQVRKAYTRECRLVHVDQAWVEHPKK